MLTSGNVLWQNENMLWQWSSYHDESYVTIVSCHMKIQPAVVLSWWCLLIHYNGKYFWLTAFPSQQPLFLVTGSSQATGLLEILHAVLGADVSSAPFPLAPTNQRRKQLAKCPLMVFPPHSGALGSLPASVNSIAMLETAYLLIGLHIPERFWAKCWTKTHRPFRLGVGHKADILTSQKLFLDSDNREAIAEK